MRLLERSVPITWPRLGCSNCVLNPGGVLAGGDKQAASRALCTLDESSAARAADHLRARLRDRVLARVPRGPRRTTTAHAAAQRLDPLRDSG